jgi:hypothetical protein
MVYVDGFNLYKGVLEANPAWKWLNLQSFFEALRLNEDVVGVRYFTAVIDPHLRYSDRKNRQAVYWRALETLPKVTRIEGRYQLRTVKCGARGCPRQEHYQVPEEKKTDVNIVVRLMDDAINRRMDTAVIVSGDSDLEPAIEWVRRQHMGIKVSVYIPVLPHEAGQRQNHFYRQIGVTCRDLPLNEITRYPLPDPLPLPNGQMLAKPVQWI